MVHCVYTVYNVYTLVSCLYSVYTHSVNNVYIQRMYRLCVLSCALCVPIIRDGVFCCQEMSQRMRKDISLVQDLRHHNHLAELE